MVLGWDSLFRHIESEMSMGYPNEGSFLVDSKYIDLELKKIYKVNKIWKSLGWKARTYVSFPRVRI